MNVCRQALRACSLKRKNIVSRLSRVWSIHSVTLHCVIMLRLHVNLSKQVHQADPILPDTIHLLSYPPVFHDDFMPFMGVRVWFCKQFPLKNQWGKTHVLGAQAPWLYKENCQGNVINFTTQEEGRPRVDRVSEQRTCSIVQLSARVEPFILNRGWIINDHHISHHCTGYLESPRPKGSRRRPTLSWICPRTWSCRCLTQRHGGDTGDRGCSHQKVFVCMYGGGSRCFTAKLV